MKHLLSCSALIACMGIAAANAQTPSAAAPAAPPLARGDGAAPVSKPFGITKADPALDAIVSSDAKLELMGDRFGLTEGPVWIRDGKSGYLVVSDLIENASYKIDADNNVSVFLDKAGYSGNDINNAGTQTRRARGYVLMIGPNGATLDPQGRYVWCASNDGTIVRLEKDGTRTVLASGYQGKRFNGPNDVVVKSDGAIYFTDSDFGLRGGPKSPDKQLPFNAVWLVKDGNVSIAIDDKALGGFDNGIALAPDDKSLYLTSGFKRIMRYNIQPDDTLGTGTVFAEGGVGIGDGLKTDRNGDVFSTGGAGPGEVRVTSAEGKFLGSLDMPVIGGEPKRQICATNDAFGGPDGKTLFIAACEAVYKIRLKVVGVVPGPAQ